MAIEQQEPSAPKEYINFSRPRPPKQKPSVEPVPDSSMTAAVEQQKRANEPTADVKKGSASESKCKYHLFPHQATAAPIHLHHPLQSLSQTSITSITSAAPSTTSTAATRRTGRTRARDLKPKASLPTLAESRAESPDALPELPAMEPTRPRLQPRNARLPRDNDIVDFGEMIKSLGEEAHDSGPKSSFDWDSDEEDVPKWRRNLPKLKRRSGDDEERSPTGGSVTNASLISSSPLHKLAFSPAESSHSVPSPSAPTSATRGVSVIYDPPKPPPRPVHATTPPATIRKKGSMEYLASKWLQKIRGRSNRTPNELDCLPPSPREETLREKKSPHEPANPSKLRYAAASAGKDGLPPVVTPWKFPTADARMLKTSKEAEARAFMEKVPPPPIPVSPIKSAGRVLRSTKSDSSIRTTATGHRLAPEIDPPTHHTEMDIINPDNNPLVYIAKVATPKPPASSSLSDAHWEHMMENVKARHFDLRAEDEREAQEEAKGRKPTSKQAAEARAKARIKDAHRLITHSSKAGFAPIKAFSAMTRYELELVGSILEEEMEDMAKGKSVGRVKRMFKRTNPDVAKQDIIKHAQLARQKHLIDTALKLEEKGELSAYRKIALQQLGDHLMDEIREAVNDLDNDRPDEAAARFSRAIATPDIARQQPSETPGSGPRRDVGWLDRASDYSTEYGSTDAEREKAYQVLCAPAPQDGNDGAVGLGIFNADGSVFHKRAGAKNRLAMRSMADYTASELDDFMKEVASHKYSPDPDDTPLSSESSPYEAAQARGSVLHLKKPSLDRKGSSFMRILTEKAKERELKLTTSHPAMRSQYEDSSVQLPSAEAISPNGHSPGKLASDDHGVDSGYGEESSPTAGSSPNSGVSYIDDRSYSRLLGGRDKAKDDEGYGTAPLVQEQLPKSKHDSDNTAFQPQSPLGLHARLDEIGAFLEEGETPGYTERGSYLDAEGIEWIDNPDYDPTRYEEDGTRKVDNVTEVEEITSSAWKPTINIDVDDVLAAWQATPPSEHRQHSTPEKPAVDRTVIHRSQITEIGEPTNMPTIRASFGLDGLKVHSQAGTPKHPKHDYAWDTQKVMCYGTHSPLTTPPPTADLPPLPRGTKLPSLPQEHSKRSLWPAALSSSPRAGRSNGVSKEFPRCKRCRKLCCRFAENVLVSQQPSKTLTRGSQRAAEEKVEKLRCLYPNGIEEFSTFLTCVECSDVVCPDCATVCEEYLCRQVMCKVCARGEGGRCSLH